MTINIEQRIKIIEQLEKIINFEELKKIIDQKAVEEYDNILLSDEIFYDVTNIEHLYSFLMGSLSTTENTYNCIKYSLDEYIIKEEEKNRICKQELANKQKIEELEKELKNLQEIRMEEFNKYLNSKNLEEKMEYLKNENDYSNKYHIIFRKIEDLKQPVKRIKMRFKGTIIITDPCYIIREENKHCKPENDDWEKCGYGSNMEALGIQTYLTHDTIYGDWSCTTYEKDTEKELGHFCADAGLVSVFLLDEVLKYNPNFDYHINNKHTTTLIENFDGVVEIQVVDYEYFSEYYGEKRKEKEVRVIGTGNINFFTTQTGL